MAIVLCAAFARALRIKCITRERERDQRNKERTTERTFTFSSHFISEALEEQHRKRQSVLRREKVFPELRAEWRSSSAALSHALSTSGCSLSLGTLRIHTSFMFSKYLPSVTVNYAAREVRSTSEPGHRTSCLMPVPWSG